MEELLRDYQAHGVKLVRDLVKSGRRRILVQSPTGAGKGFVLSAIIHAAHKKGKRGLFIVHKRELVNQISATLTKHQVEHGLIMAGEDHWEYPIQLASIGTLHSWVTRRKRIKPPPADFLIIDECHRLGGGVMYDKILHHYPQCVLLGFTATPARENGKSLGHYFQRLIRLSNVATLTARKFLAPANYMAPSIPDLTGVKIRAGDYAEDQLEEAVAQPKLMGAIVAHFLDHARERKAILFASGVKHSKFLAQEFQAVGIKAAHLDGKTGDHERDETMAAFRAGRFQVLCNAQLFIEGIDVPDCDCIIMAKPTRSIVRYLQMGGRGLRPAEGKRDCLVIDHSGNIYRHGPLDYDHSWSLDATTTVAERDAMKPKPKDKDREFKCGQCATLFSGQPLCPNCGAPLEQAVRDVEVHDAQLRKVDPEKVRKALARADGKEGKRAFWERCLHQCKHTNRKVGAAAHMYKDRYGVWPNGRVLGRANVPHGSQEWNVSALEFLQIRNSNARQPDETPAQSELYVCPPEPVDHTAKPPTWQPHRTERRDWDQFEWEDAPGGEETFDWERG